MSEAFSDFYMVLRNGSTYTSHRHQTLEGAKAEASHLAHQHPNTKFYVLHCVGAAICHTMVTWQPAGARSASRTSTGLAARRLLESITSESDCDEHGRVTITVDADALGDLDIALAEESKAETASCQEDNGPDAGGSNEFV